MSDPLSTTSKLAKAPTVIDKLTGGALSDFKALILPDIDRTLREKADAAHEAMWISVVLVARALVAGILDVDPSHEDVSRFFNDAAADPSFAARTMRLLSQGIRSPSERRRRMLALALFRPHEEPETRDQVDEAVERLQPADVELLRSLDVEDADRRGRLVGTLERQDSAADPSRPKGSFAHSRETYVRSLADPRIHAPCSVASLMRLEAAHCIELAPTGHPLGNGAGDGNYIFYPLRTLHVLLLGRDLLGALKDERAIADIDESGARGR